MGSGGGWNKPTKAHIRPLETPTGMHARSPSCMAQRPGTHGRRPQTRGAALRRLCTCAPRIRTTPSVQWPDATWSNKPGLTSFGVPIVIEDLEDPFLSNHVSNVSRKHGVLVISLDHNGCLPRTLLCVHAAPYGRERAMMELHKAAILADVGHISACGRRVTRVPEVNREADAGRMPGISGVSPRCAGSQTSLWHKRIR